MANPGWKALGPEVSEAALRAAKMQHHCAVQIRERMKEKKLTLKAYARATGSSYDRIGKMLRGEVIMRLEDIAIADIVLDEVSDFASGVASRREQVVAVRA